MGSVWSRDLFQACSADQMRRPAAQRLSPPPPDKWETQARRSAGHIDNGAGRRRPPDRVTQNIRRPPSVFIGRAASGGRASFLRPGARGSIFSNKSAGQTRRLSCPRSRSSCPVGWAPASRRRLAPNLITGKTGPGGSGRAAEAAGLSRVESGCEAGRSGLASLACLGSRLYASSAIRRRSAARSVGGLLLVFFGARGGLGACFLRLPFGQMEAVDGMGWRPVWREKSRPSWAREAAGWLAQATRITSRDSFVRATADGMSLRPPPPHIEWTREEASARHWARNPAPLEGAPSSRRVSSVPRRAGACRLGAGARALPATRSPAGQVAR